MLTGQCSTTSVRPSVLKRTFKQKKKKTVKTGVSGVSPWVEHCKPNPSFYHQGDLGYCTLACCFVDWGEKQYLPPGVLVRTNLRDAKLSSHHEW
jgi:hypothetical protein